MSGRRGASSGRPPRTGDPRAGERHVAELLARRFGVDDPTVLQLVRLTVRAAAAGHSCLDLALLDDRLVASLDARRRARDDSPSVSDAPAVTPDASDASDATITTSLPTLEQALDALARSPAVEVVGAPAEGTGEARIGRRPLVLVGTRLATQREHAAEQRIIAALLRRRAAAPRPVPLAATAMTDDPDQVTAVAALGDAGVRAGIGVLAGGPGTGKTTTVAAFLAARVAAQRALPTDGSDAGSCPGPDDVRIALAAPTGKAAARLTQALHGALPQVAGVHGEEVARALGRLEATTVHRLLGIGRDGVRRSDAPLPHDLVIVDEASMLALPLAATLLGALDSRTQLVLVGDPDQLESVETGSVLRALVDTFPGAGNGGPVARLTRNHRLAADDVGADELARAVRDGDTDTVVALARAAVGASGSLCWVPQDADTVPLSEVAGPLLDDGHGGGLHAAMDSALRSDGAGALQALDGTRLLCAHRHGPYGTSVWATRLRSLLGAMAGAGGASTGDPWLPGEPVMVLANDGRSGLVNGDTGVVVGPGAARRLVFARRDGTLLERPASSLPDVTSAYAVTVHKSQGSEYGTVVVILPPPTSPLATRELLYTAITRARRRVVLVGGEAALRAAVDRPSVRMGGLADGLSAALAAPSG
jgi:exodeoxyribonuclease V alpha subunit